MPTNTNTGYLNPTAMLAPDVAVEQMRIQRQQDLVDAMRQMALAPTVKPSEGGAVWAQGLAKMGEALLARRSQKGLDTRSIANSRALGDQLFGRSQPQGGGDPTSSAGLPPVRPQAQLTPEAQQGLNAVNAQPETQQPAPQPQQQQSYPLSLTGNRQQDMTDYVLSPTHFAEKLIDSHAPVDFTRLLHQSGIDPNSALGRQLMQSQVAKQNYIAPVNGRPGSTIRDPNDPSKILGYDAPTVEGAFPVYGPDGMPTGYQQAPGAAAAIGAAAGAKAGGTAAGQAPYELVTVTDATGNTFQIPKSSVPGIGGQPGGGAPAGGSLNNWYSHGAPGAPAPASAPSGPGGVGIPTGISPGAKAANEEAGRNSANGFSQAINAGLDAKNSMRTIDNISHAAQGLSTGPGSGMISDLKSGVNAAAGAFGHGPVFDADKIARFDEMAKNAATLGSQLASSAAGSNGVTDARLSNALRSLPGSHYSPAAVQEVATNLKGLQAAALARAQAASTWQQQHGPNSFPQFQQQWQQAYNPDVFYHMQKGVPDFQKWVGSMSAADRQRTLNQYRQMKAMGGL